MKSLQLQELLEKKFVVSIPEEVFADVDVTLITLSKVLRQGGLDDEFGRSVLNRSCMYETWKVVEEARKIAAINSLKKSSKTTSNKSVLLPVSTLKQLEIKASLDTDEFIPGCGAQLAPITSTEETIFSCWCLVLFGVFYWFPLVILALIFFVPFVWLIGILALLIPLSFLWGKEELVFAFAMVFLCFFD